MILPAPLRFDADQVKRRAVIVAIVSRYTRLKSAGGQYIALCPFHSERHPSFYIEPLRKIFHCFGCGVGGDVFDFVMRAEKCDFRRALELATSFVGVAVESGPQSGPRFLGGVGAKPLKPAKQASSYSPSNRDNLVACLDATNARLMAIRAANEAASTDLATACEPDRGNLLEFEG